MPNSLSTNARQARASRLRSILAFNVFSACVAIPAFAVSTARAEAPSSYARAQDLFSEGRRLSGEGRHAEACERFERSLRLEAGIGTKFNLADCWEKLGKTASARSLFADVAAAAESSGQDARARVARERAEALEPRLSKLTISVESASPKLRVVRNGEAVQRESWGTAIAVDPGSYEVRASAPGKADWVVRTEVPARAAEIVLSVPPLSDAGAQAAETESCEAGPSSPHATAQRARPAVKRRASLAPTSVAPARRSWGPVPVALAALSAGGLAAGTLFALKYRSNNAEAKSICEDEPTCSEAQIERHRELTDNAHAARTGAFVGFGVGAAALVGAAVSYFAVPATRPEGGRRISAVPVYLPSGSYGFAAQGAF